MSGKEACGVIVIAIQVRSRLQGFHSSLSKSSLHGSCLVHKGIVLLEHAYYSMHTIVYKDISYRCVFPALWREFGEEPHTVYTINEGNSLTLRQRLKGFLFMCIIVLFLQYVRISGCLLFYSK